MWKVQELFSSRDKALIDAILEVIKKYHYGNTTLEAVERERYFEDDPKEWILTAHYHDSDNLYLLCKEIKFFLAGKGLDNLIAEYKL